MTIDLFDGVFDWAVLLQLFSPTQFKRFLVLVFRIIQWDSWIVNLQKKKTFLCSEHHVPKSNFSLLVNSWLKVTSSSEHFEIVPVVPFMEELYCIDVDELARIKIHLEKLF